jgi:hypothetical protein
MHLRSRRTRQRCEIRGRRATPSVRRQLAGALTYGAGGRAFENRLIARRSSTAAVGAGIADVDDRVKGNGSRLVQCGRGSATCRAGQPSRSLRQAPRPPGPPPLFAPTTEKWKKTAIETACSRGNCAAATFRDVAAHKRNETTPSGRRGAESAAVRRPSHGRSPSQTAARATPVLLVTIGPVRNPPQFSLSHPDFDVAAKKGAPTSTRLGERSPAHRNPIVHDQGSRHKTRKTTESFAHSLPNGRRSEVAGWNPIQKMRLVETFPTTPRSPFLPPD